MKDEEMKRLLQESLERIGEAGEKDGPARDLWPEVLRGLGTENSAHAAALPWYDVALACALAVAAIAFPATIPVFLYYL
jgi:hypothetical protein